MGRTAKRKLSDISFEAEGAHVALVSKEQGGPANNHDYALVIKANKFSEEQIQKASKIRVTMDIQDYLSKFYGLYYSDAIVLANALGFDTKEDPAEDTAEDKAEEDWYQKWIDEQVSSIEVIKSLTESDNVLGALSELEPDQYIQLLEDQAKLEKAFKKIEKSRKESGKQTKAAAPDNSTTASVEKSKVEPSGSVNLEGKSMTQTIEKEVEVVEKSALETVQKSLDETKVALEKALEQVAAFEAEKKAAIVKAKTAQITEVIKDEKASAVLVKAALSLEDADFTTFVEVVKSLNEQKANADLFIEKGATTDSAEKVEESAIVKLMKAKGYTK